MIVYLFCKGKKFKYLYYIKRNYFFFFSVNLEVFDKIKIENEEEEEFGGLGGGICIGYVFYMERIVDIFIGGLFLIVLMIFKIIGVIWKLGLFLRS